MQHSHAGPCHMRLMPCAAAAWGFRVTLHLLHVFPQLLQGGMMEQWHQKLHNNTSPDDVVICEALLAYIAAGLDIGAYWATLQVEVLYLLLLCKAQGGKIGCSQHRYLFFQKAQHLAANNMQQPTNHPCNQPPPPPAGGKRNSGATGGLRPHDHSPAEQHPVVRILQLAI